MMTYDVEYLFICLFAICISSLVRYCLFGPLLIGQFAFSLLSFKIFFFFVYFRKQSFANIFYQALAFPFILLILSFTEQTLLNLMRSSLFFFHGLCFGGVSKTSLPCPRSPTFSSVISCRSFRFYSQVYGVLGFLKGVRSGSRSTLLPVDVVVSAKFLEETLFFSLYFFHMYLH